MIEKNFLKLLWIIAAALVGIHILDLLLGHPVWQLERLFDLSRETNIPTWFTSVLWLIAAVSAYRCAQGSDFPSRKVTWLIVAAGFLILSIDEVAEMHENFGRVIERNFYPQKLAETFSATNWPLTAAPFLALFLFWGWRNLGAALKSSPGAVKWLAWGVGMVILGAMGFEMLNNVPDDNMKWLPEFGTVVEESLEMVGVIALVTGLRKVATR